MSIAHNDNTGTTNWKNRTLWTGDNLDIMRGMNSDSVDLIYLDPPFNSKQNYAAPIGSESAGAHFKDTWGLSDIDVEWLNLIESNHPKLNHAIKAAMTKSDMSYLIYMAPRLMEMRRILKPTGAIYLHCDPAMSHYLKMVMDAIFGKSNFRNEIVWHYGGRGAKAVSSQFPRNHDVILMYADQKASTFNKEYSDRVFSLDEAKKKGFRQDEHKRWFKTAPRGDYTDDSIIRLEQEGRVHRTSKGNIRIKYFLETRNGNIVEPVLTGDTWLDIPDAMHFEKSERTGYPTQKPLALLYRIIKASSNEGDMVFDPFCGCATTLVAAQFHERRWVGIDLSDVAVNLCKTRIQQHNYLFTSDDMVHRTDIPKRTDLGEIPAYNCRENREFLYGKQKGYCAGCKTHFEFRNLTVDHIISRNKGGTDHLENLQLLCGHCNSVKGARGMEYLMKYLDA